MSTEILGNVELITKGEVEAMLDDSVVSETTINEKISTASTVLEQSISSTKTELLASVDNVNASIAEEATTRASETTSLNNSIAEEESARTAAITTLTERINTEEAARESADTALSEGITSAITEAKDDLKSTETATFADVVSCVRLKNLPIAQLTLDLTDASVAVNDIIGTVGAKYLPAVPVTFAFVAELNNSGTLTSYYIVARLDANGNINVINKTALSESYSGNTNTATVTYITKE